MISDSDLTPDDQDVIATAAVGNELSLSPGARVNAHVIAALCRQERVDWRVHPKGIRLAGPRPGTPTYSLGQEPLITGPLDLSDSTISVPLLVTDCHFDEEIRLLYTRARWINLSGSLLTKGLAAEGLEIDGELDLSLIRSHGPVDLVNVSISDDLDLAGAQLLATYPYALTAGGAEVGNHVVMNDVVAKGSIRLPSAKVAGDLRCDRTSLTGNPGPSVENPKNDPRAFPALALSRATVGGAFSWRFGAKAQGDVDLSGAKVGLLDDAIDSWPDPNEHHQIMIDDFEFDAIADPPNTDWGDRKIWLRLQRPKCLRVRTGKRPSDFRLFTQPYDHLAKVYLSEGDKLSAEEVLILKKEDLRHYGDLSAWQRWMNWMLGHLTSHGYRTRGLFAAAIVIVILFAILFWGLTLDKDVQPVTSQSNGESTYFTPVGSAPRPDFEPFFYAADVFIPLVDLGQQASYRATGILASSLVTALAVSGWFVTALLAAAAGGLIRRL